jgi:hypothetical protein
VSPAHGAGIHCPYCCEEISGQRTWYRCTGRTSPRGKHCDTEVDPVLRRRTGFSDPVPPAFPAGRQRNAATCPECGGRTGVTICPVCHSRLPVYFGKIGSLLIVPVGANETGKSVFVAVLLHELMHQAGQQFNAAITGADDHTRQEFAQEYERPLYRESRLLPPTVPALAGNRPPLVFRFTAESRRPKILNGLPTLGGLAASRDPQRTLLSFFDTAGEDLRLQPSMDRNLPCLGVADGILLLVDPLQMRGARALAAPGTRLPVSGDAGDEPAAALVAVTDFLLAGNGDQPGRPIGTPLAIVFTKMDALLGRLRETSPLLQPAPRQPYFDERDSMAVHTEIQRLLAGWEGSRIDRIARTHYRTYRYFGVSALGETPTEDNRVSARGIRPYRVTSPVLWLLAQFGIIPVK